MKINLEFQPCEDCELRHHCWKYWKDKAFILAKAYEQSLIHINELKKLQSGIEALKNEVLRFSEK